MRNRMSSWMMACFMAFMLGCSVNPATGKRQFNVMSTNQELALGAQAAPEFVQSYGGEIPSSEILGYVGDIGKRLAAVSERPDLPWEFHVVDSPVINAFALPGGKVFMSRGLLEKMTNEAQLAGVLGHEVGHVTAQHIGQQMSQGMVVQAVGIVIAAIGEKSDNDYMKVLGVGATTGGSLYLLKFGRDQESEADSLGLRYMSKLGYNPAAQIQVMEILKDASGSGGGVEWMSTHPMPETRITRLESEIKKNYPDHDNVSKYGFYADRFKAQVLDRVKYLPPAKHDPKAQEAAAQSKQLRGRRQR